MTALEDNFLINVMTANGLCLRYYLCSVMNLGVNLCIKHTIFVIRQFALFIKYIKALKIIFFIFFYRKMLIFDFVEVSVTLYQSQMFRY